MEIDRRIIKALSAERRIEILKSLSKRRKMPSELSRELNLAAPTILEHLSILEEAGLVSRIETGRKWIYYDLTEKGKVIIKPKYPVNFVLVLTLGIILSIAGLFRYFFNSATVFVAAAQTTATAGKATENATNVTTPIQYASQPDYLMIILLAVGAILIVVGIYKMVRRNS